MLVVSMHNRPFSIIRSEGQKCALYGMLPIMASQNEQRFCDMLESRHMALIILTMDN